MNKVVIVTGASRGIGAAIALRAARDGYAIAVNYRHDEAAATSVVNRIRSAGGTALAVRADVGDAAAVQAMFARVDKELGPVSALVNNAGPGARTGDGRHTRLRRVARLHADGHPCRSGRAGTAGTCRTPHPDAASRHAGGNRGAGGVDAVRRGVLRHWRHAARRGRLVAVDTAACVRSPASLFDGSSHGPQDPEPPLALLQRCSTAVHCRWTARCPTCRSSS